MAGKRTLIQISNPTEGVTQEEYEAVCAALGIEPQPDKTAKTPEDAGGKDVGE